MDQLSFGEKIAILADISIFKDTDSQTLEEMAASLEEILVKKGRNIIKKGSKGDAMYFMVSGKVRIHDGNHVLARLEAGEIFGEYALIDESERSASVTADDDCLLLKLYQNDFYQIVSGRNDVLRGVLKVLVQRMRDMNVLEEKLSKSYLRMQRQKEQIERQNLSIGIQKEQLEQQNFDLTKLNEEKNHLISVMLHQLKNPLTSSLCMTEILDEGKDKLDQTEQECIRIIHKSLNRINNFVNEILDVNVIDSKVFELKYEPVKLHTVIEDLLENYKYFIEQKGLIIETATTPAEISLNKVYITQIIDNLLSNAIKFTPSGKKILISLTKKDKELIVCVADEGPGLSPDEVSTIFDQYSRQKSMGLQDEPPKGLGLAIVHKYATEMNGKVWCESTPGKGATFCVSFKTSDQL